MTKRQSTRNKKPKYDENFIYMENKVKTKNPVSSKPTKKMKKVPNQGKRLKQCRFPGCTKWGRPRGGVCVAHGGQKCETLGCPKSFQSWCAKLGHRLCEKCFRKIKPSTSIKNPTKTESMFAKVCNHILSVFK